ncbi:MAG: thioredoxin family protein, partial [Staphylothermus sp.]|nr:thioredoxin family protein [Staphylothermus sp.]
SNILDKMAEKLVTQVPSGRCCTKPVKCVGELHSLDELMEALNTCRIVVVNFYSTYCPYCQAFHPIFDHVASKYCGNAGFHRLNIDYSPETAWRLNIMGTPTTLIFIDGKIADVIYGYTYLDILEKRVIAALSKANCIEAN